MSDPSDRTARARRPTNTDDPPTIPLTLQTPEPGFLVEVDGVLARDETPAQLPLTTPCQLLLKPGPHTLRLVRRQFKDLVREFVVVDEEVLGLFPEYDPFGEAAGFYASRFVEVAVGERLDLSEINNLGPAWDPWLSADGLQLLFAGELESDRGLFLCRRAGVGDDFGPPQLLQRSSEPLASPSLSTDGLLLAYVQRDRPQVRSLVREDVEQAFRPGSALLFDEDERLRWPLVGLSADGNRLYWQSWRNGRVVGTGLATRKTRAGEFRRQEQAVELPGGQPRFSADGERIYWLEGSKLMRADRRRASGTRPGTTAAASDLFTAPRVLCTLPGEALAVDPQARQFCLSDDETWLWGSDGPRGREALFALKIQEAPTHGVVIRGRTVPHEPPTPPPDPSAPPAPPPFVKPSPRLAPLPYWEFRRNFERALADLDWQTAGELLTAARAEEALAEQRTLLEWDSDELKLVTEFWSRLERNCETLKAGESLRLRGKPQVFDSYADGVLQVHPAKGEALSVALRDLPALDLLTLGERGLERGDREGQLRSAAFLSATRLATPATLTPRLQRAGDLGKRFTENQLNRRLRELKAEAERGQIGRALVLVEQLQQVAPKSDQARLALVERDLFPGKLAWKPQGGQRWSQPTSDSHQTTTARAPGSILALAGPLGDFRLTLEWKTEGETAQGGVWFRYAGQGDLRKNAWKIVLANDAASGASDRFATGALFGVKPPTANRAKPEGEWNTLDLTVRGESLKLVLNGELTTEAILNDPNIATTGILALDGEFGGITYRKILAYELPEAE
ncbi:MAG: family 16 glycoside hydrolase [Planctomycetaceae bacterium]